jgi:hypothetical protein
MQFSETPNALKQFRGVAADSDSRRGNLLGASACCLFEPLEF